MASTALPFTCAARARLPRRMAEMLQSGQGPDGVGAAAANSLNALLRKSKKPSVRAAAVYLGAPNLPFAEPVPCLAHWPMYSALPSSPPAPAPLHQALPVL